MDIACAAAAAALAKYFLEEKITHNRNEIHFFAVY